MYPVPEVAQLLGGVTPRYVWSLIDAGQIRSVKLGRRRFIPHDALAEFLAGINVPCPEPSALAAVSAGGGQAA